MMNAKINHTDDQPTLIAQILIDQSADIILDYSISHDLAHQIKIGSRVLIKVRGYEKIGTVIRIINHSPYKKIYPILNIINTEISLPDILMILAKWISEYYFVSLNLVIKSMLPPLLKRKKTFIQKHEELIMLVKKPTLEEIAILQQKKPRQYDILMFCLKDPSTPVPLSILKKIAPISSIKKLKISGWLMDSKDIVSHVIPDADQKNISKIKLELNDAQKDVVKIINQHIDSNLSKQIPILLHGVTASGKTEIYLQTIEKIVQNRKGVIMLVPEIALTGQMIQYFHDRLADHQSKIVLLHSKLSNRARSEAWTKLYTGEANIALGTRSAIFAPVKNIGLIIVDEEHEPCYKQENLPRYHARDVAVMRGYLENALVILGSATPSIESYRNALIGKYKKVTLKERVDGRSMPHISTVDIRHQGQRFYREGGLSAPLQIAIYQRLKQNEQIILFLNRRGFATKLLCRVCGYIASCDSCTVALTFHQISSLATCHICGTEKQLKYCPFCQSKILSKCGLGTQKIESIVKKLYPKARIARIDSDTLKAENICQKILQQFKKHEIDILIGTQMVAKGLDFPHVTLVGIINADIGLHLADFRAGERTFQLLTQVAGRSGRGDKKGEVIIQTFNPSHPIIQYSLHHQYTEFFEHEINFRKILQLPPFTKLVNILIQGKSLEIVEKFSKNLASQLQASVLSNIQISQALLAPLEKSHGKYRFQILLKSSSSNTLYFFAKKLIGLKLPNGIMMTLDRDPYLLR